MLLVIITTLFLFTNIDHMSDTVRKKVVVRHCQDFSATANFHREFKRK